MLFISTGIETSQTVLKPRQGEWIWMDNICTSNSAQRVISLITAFHRHLHVYYSEYKELLL